MARVRIDELQEGMALSEDVLDGNGQVMMRAGAELGERDFRRFRMWGIIEVGIAGEDGDEGDHPGAAIDPELLAICEPEARRLFMHTQLEHPFMALLFKECLHRMAREKQGASRERA